MGPNLLRMHCYQVWTFAFSTFFSARTSCWFGKICKGTVFFVLFLLFQHSRVFSYSSLACHIPKYGLTLQHFKLWTQICLAADFRSSKKPIFETFCQRLTPANNFFVLFCFLMWSFLILPSLPWHSVFSSLFCFNGGHATADLHLYRSWHCFCQLWDK